jgi:uncharacterized protein with PIN domain
VSAHRIADVRFYIDADLLGLAKILAAVRYDVTYPGDPGAQLYRRQRPPCPIVSPAMLDHEWLPKVAAQGWVVITRDRRIRGHRAEIAAVRENGARLVTLSSAEAVSKFAQLEIVMCRWRDIEGCTNEPGPFIYQATRTTFPKLDIA